jgi:hypothetical protein
LLRTAPNRLEALAPDYRDLREVVRVLDAGSAQPFQVVMDRGKGRAVCLRTP